MSPSAGGSGVTNALLVAAGTVLCTSMATITTAAVANPAPMTSASPNTLSTSTAAAPVAGSPGNGGATSDPNTPTGGASPDNAVVVTIDPSGRVISMREPDKAPSYAPSGTSSGTSVPSPGAHGAPGGSSQTPVPRSGTPGSSAPGATSSAPRVGTSTTHANAPVKTPRTATPSWGEVGQVSDQALNLCSGQVFAVAPGYTLAQISRATGVSVDAITNVNQLRDVNLIYKGSSLCIPRL